MKGQFLMHSHEDLAEANIYADKSALVLDWLLRQGIRNKAISIREVAKETRVSIGLVQRVFSTLTQNGLLQTEGVRTAKKFAFKKPKLLMQTWLDHYNIVKKCNMRTYRSSLSDKTQLVNALKQSRLGNQVVLALHSSAEAHGYKNTNLDSLELYMLESSIEPKLIEVLQLEPQERGYEVLLIEPYYKALVRRELSSDRNIAPSPVLLTFLDLHHFPLRGQEQAEFMAKRAPEIQAIFESNRKK